MVPKTETLTVLFVDISDSTRLYDEFGDELGWKTLTDNISLLRRCVADTGGRVIDQIGDELMCVYSTPASAAEAARTMQLAMLSGSPTGRLSAPTRIRIGFHHGTLLIDGSRLFGETVHVARRVASAAKSQQILLSGATLREIPTELQLPTRFVDCTHVKGKSEAVELIELLWDHTANTVSTGAVRPVSVTGDERRLRLLHLDRQFEVHDTRPILKLGRGDHCDVVIRDTCVSREHAQIEYRSGSFMFVDCSTNGSLIIDSQGNPHFTHRAAYPLSDRGTIVLGSDAKSYNAPHVAYRLETTLSPNPEG